MASRIAAPVVACGDPAALAAFWCRALDVCITRRWTDAHGTPFVEIGGEEGLVLTFQQAGAVPAPGRIHLDIRPVDRSQSEEVARLVLQGARVLEDDPSAPWVVMSDPEGNRFCVLSPRGGAPAAPRCA